MRAASLVLLLLAALLPPGGGSARAETLVTGLSASIISIESNFTGSEIVLFGTIEPDAQTIARPEPYDIVVVVRGPVQQVVVRRKERLAGIWMNADWREFVEFPSYLAMISSRPISDMATPDLLIRYQLGLDYQILLQPSGPASAPAPGSESFERAAIRLKRQRDLFLEQPYGVQFLSATLFQARIPLPATVPVGSYETVVYLLRGGALLSQGRIDLLVRKSGFEQMVYSLAREQPLVYGAGAALIALLAGWLAGFIFRR